MTPLVLLPGMMCDARLFEPQNEAFSGNRVCHVAPISAYDTIEALAADVLQNAPPRFALAGLSMGGIVAMEILAQAPDRVAGLALMDTNPLAEPKERQAVRDVQIEAVRNGGLESVMRNEMKPHYLADGENRKSVLDLCMEMAMSLGPVVFEHQSRALAGRKDQTKTLSDANCPSLILCGREDRLCPISRHELMHEIMPGSTLKIIDGAGHLPVLEQAEATNDALSQWLAQVD